LIEKGMRIFAGETELTVMVCMLIGAWVSQVSAFVKVWGMYA
jgi:hypothetical protein